MFIAKNEAKSDKYQLSLDTTIWNDLKYDSRHSKELTGEIVWPSIPSYDNHDSGFAYHLYFIRMLEQT